MRRLPLTPFRFNLISKSACYVLSKDFDMSMNTPGYQDELEKNIMYNWKQPKKKKLSGQERSYKNNNDNIIIDIIIIPLFKLGYNSF